MNIIIIMIVIGRRVVVVTTGRSGHGIVGDGRICRGIKGIVRGGCQRRLGVVAVGLCGSILSIVVFVVITSFGNINNILVVVVRMSGSNHPRLVHCMEVHDEFNVLYYMKCRKHLDR
jgi:hypothetical protein